jgi:hypothetical protein
MLRKGTYDVLYSGDHIYVLRGESRGCPSPGNIRAVMNIIPGKGKGIVGVLTYRTKSKGTMYGIVEMKDCGGKTTLTLDDGNKGRIVFELGERLTIR